MQLQLLSLLLALSPYAAAEPGSELPPYSAASDVRQRVVELEYHYSQAAAGSWSAPNRMQGLRANAGPDGVRIEPRERPDWGVRLWTTGFGPMEAVAPLGAAQVSADRNRVTLSRGDVVEWFINQESGIEQGWTLAGPASGDVWIGLGVEGLGFRAAVDGLGGEFVAGDGSVKLRSTGLYAFDAGGRTVPARYEAGPEGLGIRVNTNGAAFPITVDPLLTAAAWSFQSSQVDAWLGTSVAAAGDINGDGIGDLVVGAPKWDSPGYIDDGAVFVFYGSNSGLGNPIPTLVGGQNGANFGNAVAGVGDLNNDGFADLAVGAPKWDNTGFTDDGTVFVYLGSAGGLLPSPIRLAGNQNNRRLGQSVAFVGDVDGDGYGDLIAGAPGYSNGQASEGAVFLFKGSSTGIAPLTPYGIMEVNVAGAELGTSVGGANDLNGDGRMDVVAGAPRQDNPGTSGVDEGAVHVWLGTPAGTGGSPSWSGFGLQANARLGSCVAGVGDVNGDRYPDIIAGAPNYNNGQAGEGAAFLYLGGNPTGSGILGFAWMGSSNQSNAHYGSSVSAAGDVNGDGYADVVVGAPDWLVGGAKVGCIQLYHGRGSGTGLPVLPTTPTQILTGAQAGRLLGRSVCAAGDVNNDGLGDVVAGAPEDTSSVPPTSPGAAFVFHGQCSGPSAPQWYGTSNMPSAEYGTSVAFVGDLNGDGFSDHVVGAYNWDEPGKPNCGRAYVYLGGPFGSSTPQTYSLVGTIEGQAAFDRLGNCVAGAGDVNRDGYSDFLVGARLADAPLADSGRVYLYFGSVAGFNPNPVVLNGDQMDAQFGHWVAGIGDINGDGYADFSASAFKYDCSGPNGTVLNEAGRVYVWFGRAQFNSTTPNWIIDGAADLQRFGSNVASGGDVNRDGFADLVVGCYSPGIASVYLGRFQPLTATPVLNPNPVWSHPLPAGCVLSSAESAGDLNGDGYSDLALGSSNFTATGAVLIFNGSHSGPATTASRVLSEVQTQASVGLPQSYGLLATSAGDINNDGYEDLLVSAFGWDNGQTDEGKVFAYLGSASGVLPTAYWTTESNETDARLGISIAGGGDSNGDGFGDMLPAAYRYGFPLPAQGYVFLHCGGGVSGGPSAGPRMLRSNGTTSIAPGGGTGETAFVISLQQRSQPLPTGVAGGSTTGLSSGRGQMRLAWEAVNASDPFANTGLQRGAFADSGTYTAGYQFFGNSGWLGNGRMKWRARFESKSPLAPSSVWFHPPSGCGSSMSIRVQTDCNGNGQADELDPDLNLNGVADACESVVIPFCFGDGTGTACPCANNGVAGNGCASSVNASGANLNAAGLASIAADTLILTGMGMPNSSALYFQGTTQQSGGGPAGAGLGVAFGDGLRCAAGAVVRLGTKTNVAGRFVYPIANDQSISQKGQVTQPGTRTYQIWYRNSAAFCTASTFNLTNGVQLTWLP